MIRDSAGSERISDSICRRRRTELDRRDLLDLQGRQVRQRDLDRGGLAELDDRRLLDLLKRDPLLAPDKVQRGINRDPAEPLCGAVRVFELVAPAQYRMLSGKFLATSSVMAMVVS